METKVNITIKEATKKKADFVDKEIDTILKADEGTSTILGFKVKRNKNRFIIL